MMTLSCKKESGDKMLVHLTSQAGARLVGCREAIPAETPEVKPGDIWLVKLGGTEGYYATGALTVVKVGTVPKTGTLRVRTLEHQTRWPIDKVEQWMIKLELS